MGLATFNGIIKLAALKRRFKAFYSPELLSMLNVKPADIWVRRVATGVSSSPVENLLMWHFLGLTAEKFTLSIGRTSFFEPGPWPCLNPTCSHYGKNAIQTFKQRVDERGQLFGLFSCSCGFIYSRQGPDMSGVRRVELHKIVETGPMWQDALRQWWFDETLTVEAICKRFNTYEYTVHQIATNLGLPRNRPGQSELAQPPEIFKLERAEKKQQLIATYRIKLIEFVKANPEVSRSALQRVHLVAVCANLMKFDRKWFEAHAPKRQNVLHRVSKMRVDFESLDEKTHAMVAIARGALLMRTGAPTRISRHSLCKELGYKNGFHSSISKLEKTNKALNQASESLFDVALRRLEWIITQTEGRAIKPKDLLHRASVRKAWLAEPKTRKAIFTVMLKYYNSIELIVL